MAPILSHQAFCFEYLQKITTLVNITDKY